LLPMVISKYVCGGAVGGSGGDAMTGC
jgi:hypothetical protein